jgi:hypothetical protein
MMPAMASPFTNFMVPRVAICSRAGDNSSYFAPSRTKSGVARTATIRFAAKFRQRPVPSFRAAERADELGEPSQGGGGTETVVRRRTVNAPLPYSLGLQEIVI